MEVKILADGLAVFDENLEESEFEKIHYKALCVKQSKEKREGTLE